MLHVGVVSSIIMGLRADIVNITLEISGSIVVMILIIQVLVKGILVLFTFNIVVQVFRGDEVIMVARLTIVVIDFVALV